MDVMKICANKMTVVAKSNENGAPEHQKKSCIVRNKNKLKGDVKK